MDKQDILEILKPIFEAMNDQELQKSMATAFKGMLDNLMEVGFSREEAMQIVLQSKPSFNAK